MGIIQTLGTRLANAVRFQRKETSGTLMSIEDAFGEWLSGYGVSKSGVTVNHSTALQTAVVLACVRLISEGIAQVPFRVMRDIGASKKEPATDHPLHDLLAVAPNEWMTSYEFRETLAMHVVLSGDGYAYIVRGAGGRIMELLPMEPSTVSVRRNGWDLRYLLRFPDGESIEVGPSEVWHWRGPSWNSWAGLDAVALLREAIGLSVAAEEMSAKMFSNGGRLSGVLSTPAIMGPDQLSRMRDDWMRNYGGSSNSGKTAILHGEWKWQSLSMNANETGLQSQRDAQIGEICRGFRVNPVMIGHGDKLATYASVEQQMLSHVKHTLAPWHTRIEQSADKQLLTKKERASGYYTKFFTQGLLRGAMSDRIAYYTGMYNIGSISPNEIRELEDMNPYEHGDEYRIPLNMVEPGAEPPPTEGAVGGPAGVSAPQEGAAREGKSRGALVLFPGAGAKFSYAAVGHLTAWSDIPSDEWLADELVRVRARASSPRGVPPMLTITGGYTENVALPVDLLSGLKSEFGSEESMRPATVEWLTEVMERTGRLPTRKDGSEHVPVVRVAHNGLSWVRDGIHRIEVAKRLGWKSLPVEIRYYDGGERAGGVLSPESVRDLIAPTGTKYSPDQPRDDRGRWTATGGAPTLRVDNPGGGWLRGAQEAAQGRGRDKFGAPAFGDVTGAYDRPAMIPMEVASKLPGLRNEQSHVRPDSLSWLTGEMGRTGKLPLTESGGEYVPFVMVAHNGEAWVSEGNHRIMAAHDLGWKAIPIEIRYFDGGEQADGPLHPDRVRAFYRARLRKSDPMSYLLDRIGEVIESKYDPDQPRAPAGSEDGGQWVAAGAGGDPDGESTVTVYHGTAEEVWASIANNGIDDKFADRRNWEESTADDARAKSVFVAREADEALAWATSAAYSRASADAARDPEYVRLQQQLDEISGMPWEPVDAIRMARGERYGELETRQQAITQNYHEKVSPIVVRVTVPLAAVINAKPDAMMQSSGSLMFDRIPPEWIVDGTVYARSPETHAFVKDRVLKKSADADAYAEFFVPVLVLKPDPAKSDPMLALLDQIGEVVEAKFDPDQPRAPAGSPDGGQWVSSGGEAMISPNVDEGLGIDSAIDRLDSERHKRLRDEFDAIDKAMGIKSQSEDAIGAWADGAEDSVVVEYQGASMDDIAASASMKGLISDQKAVLAFSYDSKGSNAMHSVVVRGESASAINRSLVKAGVEFHTLVPHGDSTKVMVFDEEGHAYDNLMRWADERQQVVQTRYGNGRFIGSWDSRDDGATAYRAEIARWLGESGAGGDNRRAEWDRIRNRWGKAQSLTEERSFDEMVSLFDRLLATVEAKYNPDQPRDPAGVPSGGQWTRWTTSLDMAEHPRDGSTAWLMELSDEQARKALKLDPKRNTNREIGEAIVADIIANHAPIADDDVSQEAIEKVGNALAKEVQYGLENDPDQSGKGWYSEDYPQAVAYLAERRAPELLTNRNARVTFDLLVAITSNGEDVVPNIKTAFQIYEQWRAGVDLKDVVIPSVWRGDVGAALAKVSALNERLGSMVAVSAYLREPLTVAQINVELKAHGQKPNYDYPTDMVLPRAAVVLSAKIGAFYANLSGDAEYLTMDRWWNRSVNHIRGTILPRITDTSMDSFITALGRGPMSREAAIREAGVLAKQIDARRGWTDIEIAMGQKEPTTKAGTERFHDVARERIGYAYEQLKLSHDLERRANTIWKTETMLLQDAPFRGTDRKFQYEAARHAQKVLAANGHRISISDIQAAEWYYEKRLFEKLSGSPVIAIGYREAIMRLADRRL